MQGKIAKSNRRWIENIFSANNLLRTYKKET